MENLADNIDYITKRSHRFDVISKNFLTEESVHAALARVNEKLVNFTLVAKRLVSQPGNDLFRGDILTTRQD